MWNSFITGRMTGDAELKKTPNDLGFVSFTIADNRGKDKPANFVRCIAYGKQAETLSRFTQKGDMLSVVGRTEIQKYTDRNGVERQQVALTISDFMFISQPADDGAKNTAPAQSHSTAYGAQNTTAQEISDDYDDMPF